MFELTTVTMGEWNGQGYAFKRKTAFGEARRGVFFPEDPDQFDGLSAGEELEYSGPCYYRGRQKPDQSFSVLVTGRCSTFIGERIDFVAADNPDPLIPESDGRVA